MTIYLYIKQHSITKLLYFGRTTRKNPYLYKGSGTYWKRHIKLHGRQYIKTISVQEFEEQDEATAFALHFSDYWDIVKSDNWANLVIENGTGGSRYKHCKDKYWINSNLRSHHRKH
jgi:hypothetical protein